jgi:hypothetical protein
MARHSISFYVCAAFLALFGVIGLNGVDPGTAKIELLLALVVAGAGLYLHSGAEQARTVGLGVLAVVIGYGFWRLTQGGYVPGTIVAGIALFRLATAGSTSPAPARTGNPQAPVPQPYPPGYGQPPAGPQQQIFYGQQPLGAPAPYGSPAPYAAPAPYAPPASPAPTAPAQPTGVGDPRFGPPVPAAPSTPPPPAAPPGSPSR